jgi:hypothetical protein
MGIPSLVSTLVDSKGLSPRSVSPRLLHAQRHNFVNSGHTHLRMTLTFGGLNRLLISSADFVFALTKLPGISPFFIDRSVIWSCLGGSGRTFAGVRTFAMPRPYPSLNSALQASSSYS